MQKSVQRDYGNGKMSGKYKQLQLITLHYMKKFVVRDCASYKNVQPLITSSN